MYVLPAPLFALEELITLATNHIIQWGSKHFLLRIIVNYDHVCGIILVRSTIARSSAKAEVDMYTRTFCARK